MPFGYVESIRYYHKYFTYWTPFEAHIFQFVTKIILDVHICPFDQHNSHVLIPLCYNMRFDISWLNQTDNDLHCKLLHEYSRFTKKQEEEEKRLLLLMEKIRKKLSLLTIKILPYDSQM